MPDSLPVVTVIQHEDGCPLDLYEGWLGDLDLQVVRPYAGDDVPDAVTGGLLVLGGTMNALADEAAPWLAATRDLLAKSVADGAPTLGICLGGQLLGVACGGELAVSAPGGPERGAVNLSTTGAAADDALFGGLGAEVTVTNMHSDALVRLPDDAVLLASSGQYPNQAFRIGERAWGVQFHPEASLETFARWTVDDRLEPDEAKALIAEVTESQGPIVSTARALAERFAGVVRAAAYSA